MKLHGDIVLMIQPSEVRQKETLVHAELFFGENTAVYALFKYIIRLSSRAWHIEAALKAVVADNAAGGEEEVEGQHAASIGRLDEAKLYYLRSRGLSEAQARRLMVDARFAPAIDKIPLDSLQDEVRENVARRLNDELDG